MPSPKYTLTDLLENPEFIDWVKNPTPERDQYWQTWLSLHPDNAELVQDARKIILFLNYKEFRPTAEEQADVKQQIFARPEPVIAVSRQRVNYWYAAAATVALLLISSLLFFRQPAPESYVARQQAIKTILLPDGSTVVLNKNSKLTLSDWKNSRLREVKLEGEAYFDIVKNKHKPFIVRTGEVNVKVLGTKFYVSAYKENPTVEATLLSGAVKIEAENREDVYLKPMQQAIVHKTLPRVALNKIQKDTNARWKNRKLLFRNTDFATVFKQLEKEFGVELVLDDKVGTACGFTGSFDGESLPFILNMIRKISDITYTIEGDKVYIAGNPCQARTTTN